uniref:DNA damage-regulated autophagy modulator protein 2 n=1 Tax=Syphacia muris TaxID=451379 RepID=A0A0N5ADD3_9BILA
MLQLGILRAGHIPVVFAICFTLVLGITYVVSVWRGDVDPVFPYISAAADHRPESCLFSMMLNFCSALSMLIIYLRYSLIVELNRGSDLLLQNVNRISLVIGGVGAFGMFGVANFQETSLAIVHLVFAFLCFGCGCLYMLIESFITLHMHPLFSNRRIGYIRSLIAIISFFLFITAVTFGVLASSKFHKVYPHLPIPRPWSRKLYEPGYECHCVSAVCEWFLAVANTIFFLSYSRDFEKIVVELRVSPLVSHLDHSPLWQSTSDLTHRIG